MFTPPPTFVYTPHFQISKNNTELYIQLFIRSLIPTSVHLLYDIIETKRIRKKVSLPKSKILTILECSWSCWVLIVLSISSDFCSAWILSTSSQGLLMAHPITCPPTTHSLTTQLTSVNEKTHPTVPPHSIIVVHKILSYQGPVPRSHYYLSPNLADFWPKFSS